MSNSNNQRSKWREREVGSLWKRKTEKGSYCTGYIVSDELGSEVKQRVIMFANKTKTNDKSPDFIIYKSVEPDTKPNEAGITTEQAEVKTPQNEFDDDNIPM